MAVGPDLRLEVDAFLGARKTLPARGEWREVNRLTERRLRLPIEAGGEISAFDLELIVAPDSPAPALRIVLLYGRPIWRLCLGSAYHPNSIVRPADLAASVDGPHMHTWPDNRHFAKANRLPKDLKNARLLPDSVVTNDDAFAFFLGIVGIEFPSWGSPIWPTREGLI